MTCHELREYLFAFLDSELDASLSIEAQRHVDRCHACAQQVEIERAIRRQLTLALEREGIEPAFDEPALSRRLMSSTKAKDLRLRSRWRPSRPVIGVVAAGLGLAIGLWIVGGEQDAGTDGSSFIALLVADYEHFIERGQPVDLASADPQVVSEWIRGETGIAVDVAAPSGKQCRLVGARRCKIDGETAAFAAYEMDGQPATLVALAGGRIDLDGMRETRRGENTHWVDRCKGHTVVACRRGDLVVAVVGRLGEQELLHLMSGAIYESH